MSTFDGDTLSFLIRKAKKAGLSVSCSIASYQLSFSDKDLEEFDTDLKVKHLKTTGKAYNKKAKRKQGEAFYKMRYGLILTLIAALKLSIKKLSLSYFIHSMMGFFSAMRKRSNYMVSKEEGVFIRKYRWKNIMKKLF